MRWHYLAIIISWTVLAVGNRNLGSRNELGCTTTTTLATITATFTHPTLIVLLASDDGDGGKLQTQTQHISTALPGSVPNNAGGNDQHSNKSSDNENHDPEDTSTEAECRGCNITFVTSVVTVLQTAKPTATISTTLEQSATKQDNPEATRDQRQSSSRNGAFGSYSTISRPTVPSTLPVEGGCSHTRPGLLYLAGSLLIIARLVL